MAAQPVAERPIEYTNISDVQAIVDQSRQILTTPGEIKTQVPGSVSFVPDASLT
jgi:hypothetical protein